MVDFQSRDTDRRRSTDEEDADGGCVDDDGPAENDVGEASAEPVSPAEEHALDEEAPASDSATSAAVVTVSDSRSHDDDPAGEAVIEAFESAGHDIATREVLRTGHDSVQQTVDTLVKREDVSVVVTTGAAGVGPDDVTIAAVHPLIDTALPGFGELFRRRYAESVGTDVVASRAMAGIADATPVFCLPGDPEAARLGVTEIVVEQAERVASQAGGGSAADQ